MKNIAILKRLLTLTGWRQFFKVLNKKEKVSFFVFLISAILSAFFLLVTFYLENTEIVPAAGGHFIEGVIGQPIAINPIYPSCDVDRDITELIFSGLMKYNEKGEIVFDLARDYTPSEDGKTVEVFLKENVLWHDGEPLTAEDIVFTIETIQDPDSRSPLMANWLGVRVEEISDFKIRFKLESPSSVFLENLTLQILPKHLWEEILPASFPFAVYNLKPIGSGPFKFQSLEQEKSDKELRTISLHLVKNKDYYGKIPNLEEISFYFFENEEELIHNLGKIKGFSLSSTKNINVSEYGFSEKIFSLPRYFAVFLNVDNSEILSDGKIRQALNYGTNKAEILEKVFDNKGRIIDSPILPSIFDFPQPAQIYLFDKEKAKEILEGIGFLEHEQGFRIKTVEKEKAFQFEKNLSVGSEGAEVEVLQKCLANLPDIYPEGEITGYFGSKTKAAVQKFQKQYVEGVTGSGLVGKKTRVKLNEMCFDTSEETLPLKFSLTTVNQPLMIEIANILKSQWKDLGVEIEIRTFEIKELEREIINKRDYEAILFGQVLGTIPDPFPFWHSSQKSNQGLNLTGYENDAVDELLTKARKNLNFEERIKIYQEFQDILIEDAPSVFLTSPDFIYCISEEFNGIDLNIIADPSKRFLAVENWYTKMKRVWK